MLSVGSEIGDWFSKPGAEKREPCGIFIPKQGGQDDPDDGSEKPVPLRRRDVTAAIYTIGKFSDTNEKLTYQSEVDCCAVFRFPLPPRSAVYRFRALLGDREIATKVKPRDEAREEYTLAVQQGHTAVHLSQHERGAAVYEISLGNLLAGETVMVELSYLRLLDSFGDTLEWSHVATWVPPYIGSQGDQQAGIDKVTSELPVFADKVSYSLSYDLKILTEPGAVRAIDSPQPVKVVPPAADNSSDGAGRSCCWSVSLSDQVADPSRDLTLTLEMDPRVTSSLSGLFLQRAPPATEGGQPRTFALATFVPPPFPPPPPPPTSQQQPEVQQLQQQQQQQCQKEIWFVLDCSGSMGGLPIQQARESALLFVRDLPLGDGVKFNVSCFGSGHKSLYEQCMPYNAVTEREAVAWIQQNAKADMGGTEILAVLEHVYGSRLTPGYSREVIFLTDGGISGHEEGLVYDMVTPPPPKAQQQAEAKAVTATAANTSSRFTSVLNMFRRRSQPSPDEDEVAAPRSPAVAEASRRTHVLCLGIGDGVHRGLLDGIARRSGGLAAYVVSDEAIAGKTAFLKKAALARGGAVRPRLVTHGSLVRPAPHVLPQRMFAGEPLQVLLEVVSCEPDGSLELLAEGAPAGEGQGQGATGEMPAAAPAPQLRLELPLGREVGGEVEAGEALGVLHAMAYIDSLMSGTSPLHVSPDGTPLPTPPSEDLVRQTVVRTAVAANLVTLYTSAVGVSLRRNPADPAVASRVVEVPLQVPNGRTLWQCDQQQQQQQQQQPLQQLAMAMPGGGARGMLVPQSMCFKRCGRTVPLRSARMRSAAVNLMGAVLPAGLFGGGTAAPPRSSYSSIKSVSGAAAPPAHLNAWAEPVDTNLTSTYDTKEVEGDSLSSFLPVGARGPNRPNGINGLVGSSGGARAVKSTPVDDVKSTGELGPRLSGGPLLSFLNLHRTTEGFWRAGSELSAALGLPLEVLVAGAQQGSSPAQQVASPLAVQRPVGLCDDGWATLVVLAVLRKRLASQPEVWADMQAKALTWLEARWPAGQGRSVGAAVLAVARALDE